jgi:hypothetical protein
LLATRLSPSLHLGQQFVDAPVPRSDLIKESIRASNDATRSASVLLGESFFLCGMESVNPLAALWLNTSDPSHNAAEG